MKNNNFIKMEHVEDIWDCLQTLAGQSNWKLYIVKTIDNEDMLIEILK